MGQDGRTLRTGETAAGGVISKVGKTVGSPPGPPLPGLTLGLGGGSVEPRTRKTLSVVQLWRSLPLAFPNYRSRLPELVCPANSQARPFQLPVGD